MASLKTGLEGPDPGSLSAEQIARLRDFKIQTRIADEKYLRAHKEVKLLVSGFFRHDSEESKTQKKVQDSRA